MFGKEKEPHLGGYIIGLTDHGDPNTYATEVWDWMINNNIKSVLDIGCGQGFSTKYFLDKGIKSTGVEGGEIAYNTSPVKDNLIQHDYTKGKAPITENYDAAWCCEFVEHVEEKYVENFLDSFDKCERIFMTHAVPGQVGYHHVNCQKSEYWINKLEKRGFVYDDNLTHSLRRLTNKMHVKNTLLYFKKR